MNLVLLTTDTIHHRYFADKIARQFPFRGILLETAQFKAPFATHHPFEDERDIYERQTLLSEVQHAFHELGETVEVEKINDARALETIAGFKPDLTIVFGTGKLHQTTIGVSGPILLNLHGGNPEEYRGLDSHLWTIYHQDFGNLVTTLHKVDCGLDTGDIVAQAPLSLRAGLRLSQLRSLTTQACVSLVIQTIEMFRRRGEVPGRTQARRGRYYSFMPAVLKEDCLAKFRRHIAEVQA
jgi:methionyl-tRNA formyltransferase